jgi:hypothetical protein
MSANSQVIREYLVSLGYRVDRESEGKIDKSLERTSKFVTGLALGIKGVILGSHAMMIAWSRSMEQMYFSSRRAETTVSNLKALDFGGRNIGVNNMKEALEGMARAIRTNPGLQGLIESFGIPVSGRDKAEVAIDLLETLRKMPFYIGSQYANLFGIDPDTFLLLSQGLDKMKEAAAARKEWEAVTGVDSDKAAEAAREYANQLREIGELFGLLKDKAAIGLLPAFKELAGVTKDVILDWIKILDRPLQDWKDAFTLPIKNRATSMWNSFMRWGGAKAYQDPDGTRRAVPLPPGRVEDEFGAVKDDPESLFQMLESRYGLPRGLLDKMWAKESARGKYMLSPAGAQGHFQFMPRTAREYGVDDPNDLAQSAHGAATYMQRLLRKYGGDVSLALAAYNWGQGNLDRYGVGQAPAETRDYVKTITGQPLSLQQSTSITVNSPDPLAAGRAVAGEQRGVNDALAATMRNQLGVVQ